MKTLKEKWIDALPVLAGISLLIGIFFAIGYGFSKLIPSDKERRKTQEFLVESIKLCTDNNLDVYRGGDSYWYCKPKD